MGKSDLVDPKFIEFMKAEVLWVNYLKKQN
jgi:hypothetical protein